MSSIINFLISILKSFFNVFVMDKNVGIVNNRFRELGDGL